MTLRELPKEVLQRGAIVYIRQSTGNGFRDLVGRICEGAIGAVFCLEASRLAAGRV